MSVFPCLPLISPSLLRWRLSSLTLLMLLSVVPRPIASTRRDQMATNARSATRHPRARVGRHGRPSTGYDWNAADVVGTDARIKLQGTVRKKAERRERCV